MKASTRGSNCLSFHSTIAARRIDRPPWPRMIRSVGIIPSTEPTGSEARCTPASISLLMSGSEPARSVRRTSLPTRAGISILIAPRARYGERAYHVGLHRWPLFSPLKCTVLQSRLILAVAERPFNCFTPRSAMPGGVELLIEFSGTVRKNAAGKSFRSHSAPATSICRM